jgi:hypothetical protein
MPVKTRAGSFWNMQKAAPLKNWVIGWTLAEANTAAQRGSGKPPAPKAIGSFGMLTQFDRR